MTTAETVQMALLFDHDVVDGAPVARFISHLTELVEGGFGLPEVAEAAAEPTTSKRHGAQNHLWDVPAPVRPGDRERGETRDAAP
jgi:hypothetical protein